MIPWLEHKEKLLTCSFGGYHFTNPAICFDALSIAKNSQCQYLYHTQFQEISPLSPFDVSSEKYQSVLPNTIVKPVFFINNQKVRTVFSSKTCYNVMSIARKISLSHAIPGDFPAESFWYLSSEKYKCWCQILKLGWSSLSPFTRFIFFLQESAWKSEDWKNNASSVEYIHQQPMQCLLDLTVFKLWFLPNFLLVSNPSDKTLLCKFGAIDH